MLSNNNLRLFLFKKFKCCKRTVSTNGNSTDHVPTISTPVNSRNSKKSNHPFSKMSTVENQLRHMGLLSCNDTSLAQVGGNRSYALLGDLAWLERALCRWTLKKLVSKYKFTPVTVPNLIYDDIIASCGFDPHSKRTQVYSILGTTKFKSKSKSSVSNEVTNESNSLRSICLSGTSEIPLVSMNLGKCFDVDSEECQESLPKKYCSLSRCYRAETAQKEPGLYRCHYFSKVEMVLLVEKDDTSKYLKEVVSIQEQLFRDELGLKIRTLDMPKEDLNEVAVKKFDIEAYFPLQGSWGEISSASDCSINQSTKLNIKTRSINTDCSSESGEPFVETFIGTINGTAIASPRILIALLETYRDPKSKELAIPPVLRDEMGGLKYLRSYKMLLKTLESH